MNCKRCGKMLLNKETSNFVTHEGKRVIVCDKCEEEIFTYGNF